MMATKVLSVAEMQPGIDDSTVLALANDRGALLMTEDNDFGELVFRQGLLHAGVILVRLAGFSAMAKAEMLSRTLAEHGAEMTQAFTVLSHQTLRIRQRGL